VAKPLLAVDTPSMLFRAFYALPDSITGPDGKPVNALLGTANLILREIEVHQPRAVVLCFGPDAASYRTELYPAYHAEREAAMPDDLSPQFAACPDFFSAFGWTVATSESLEADDLLGTYAKREADAGGRALLLTGDRDMYQCAGERVTVLYVKTGTKGAEEVTPTEVENRYGIGPELVPDFIALRGDPSDKIPGAPGIGPKKAADVLREYGTLENALAAGRFSAIAEDLRLYRRIATLDASAPLPSLADRSPAWTEASSLFERWGVKQLAGRLAERA
jgi:5'-3' exonuclease